MGTDTSAAAAIWSIDVALYPCSRNRAWAHGQKRVVRRTAPGDDPQCSSWRRRGTQIGESLNEVVEEHDAESRDDHVERRLELVALRIGEYEPGREALALGASASESDHRFGDIDAGAVAVGAEPSRDGQCRGACPAPDVEHVLRRAPAHRLDEQLLQRLEEPVEYLLHVDPGPSAGSVPQRNLLAIGARQLIHRRTMSLRVA